MDEIHPERLGAAGAKTALLGGVCQSCLYSIHRSRVYTPDDSPGVGNVVEVDLPGDDHIYAHGTVHEPMTIPLPQTKIESGDSVANCLLLAVV